MKMKSLILIFIALGCGLVASIGISQVMSQGGGETKIEMDQILVAKDAIDSGKPLEAAMVQLEEWPRNRIPDGALRKIEDIDGKFSSYRFFKGEPILQAKIADKLGGTTGQIPPGYRVGNIKVDEDTVMEAITPGDSVDVSVFLEQGRNGVRKTGVYTILRNVRVFAKGGQTERTVDEKGQEVRARTVSLLVKPEQFQELMLAYRLGKISLGLRPANSAGENEEMTEDHANLDRILSGRPENATDPAADGSVAQGLQGFGTLASVGAGDDEQKILHAMTLIGPTGASKYIWTEAGAAPLEQRLYGNGVNGTSTPQPAPTNPGQGAAPPADPGNPAAPATPR